MEILFQLNDSLVEEIIILKGEKEKLKIVVQEKDDVLKATMSELDDAKTVLKNLGGQSEKLDEILALRRTKLGHRRLYYIKKGKETIANPIFVNAKYMGSSFHHEARNKNFRKIVCHYCAKDRQIRPHGYRMMRD
ncbi:hypothetical protein GOBAR_DD12451 [Gossypium barbadense]|nr:hypothetical protein GOBAR_DD12451 [Gossypium barbadense]